jgi:hypothetical protein
MRRPWPAVVAALAVLFMPWMAAAQPAAHAVKAEAPSYSIWTIDGSTVHLRFILPKTEASALVSTPNGRVDAGSVAAAVLPLVSVSSAGDDCPPIVQDQWVGKIYALSLTPGFYRFEIIFACLRPDKLVLHEGVLFDRMPDHLNYARIQANGGAPVLQIFSRERQNLAVAQPGTRLAGAGPIPFLRQGIWRVLGRPDALCLAMGLLLLTRNGRDLRDAALALMAGYAIALALAFSGRISIDLGLAAATTGLTAALLGASALRLRAVGPATSAAWRAGLAMAAGLVGASILALAVAKGVSAGLVAGGLMVFGLGQLWIIGRRPAQRATAFAPAALFGLLDGMDQSSGLAVLKLPGLSLAPAFLFYDLGAIAVILTICAAAVGLGWLAGPRLRPLRAMTGEFASAGLVGLGLFWFLSRLYSM